jgi:hypothetical protein
MLLEFNILVFCSVNIFISALYWSFEKLTLTASGKWMLFAVKAYGLSKSLCIEKGKFSGVFDLCSFKTILD